MNSKYILLLLIACVSLGLWSCTDLPVEGGGIVQITGTVTELGTGLAVQNATVYLSAGGNVDSVVTGTGGSFTFEADFNAIQNGGATLTIMKNGFESKIVDIPNADVTTFSVALRADLSTSALIVGTLRDSTTLYPLRNGQVILTLPGVVDQFITSVDGSFRLTADLVDRDSLPVTLTLVKEGYKTKSFTVMVYRGQTRNLNNVLMHVDAGSTIAQVLGRVLDNTNRLPVNNATVVISTPIYTDSMVTSGDGSFTFTVNLQGLSSVAGDVTVTKSGYRSNNFSFSVNAGGTFAQDITITRDTTTGVPRDSSGTGNAHSIALVSVSAREISVYGVGGRESSILIWEVRDSLGFPIDIDHRDTVTFSITGVPAGGTQGAYVSPSSVMTNVSGRVATTVNSGTISGVMQFVARLRRESDGAVIQSTPVIITVNAGLPDQNWFSIGAERHNVPGGYDYVNVRTNILVQVGDKYSNPVKQGTAIYFNTTGGVVDASGFTDASSHATVTLYSGNPLPILPELAAFPLLYGDGTGYLWTRAHTLGENGVDVSDSTLMLFSGSSEIFLDTTFSELKIDSGKSVYLPIRISDRFGNPLGAGTTIRTTVEFNPPPLTNWSVLVSGLPEDPFTDFITRGPNRTEFNVRIADGTPGGTPQDMPFVVKINVSSPNGNVAAYISGKVGP